ncbi:MAG TPA: hypothetical protein VH186_04340 [Chloroflexia bacterium]|nr:hypothetical protein [Chloroflexia bacterium]
MRITDKKKSGTIVGLVALAALTLSSLLAACGDATATPAATTSAATTAAATTAPASTAAVTTAAATTAASTSMAATTATTTSAAATTAASSTTTAATSATTAATGATTAASSASGPQLVVSDTTLAVGKTLYITGKGLPASTMIDLLVSGPDGKSKGKNFSPVTGTDGSFQSWVVLDKYPDGTPVQPGKLTLTLATMDGKTLTSASVDIVAATNAPR